MTRVAVKERRVYTGGSTRAVCGCGDGPGVPGREEDGSGGDGNEGGATGGDEGAGTGRA
jgi:hypothetical protein